MEETKNYKKYENSWDDSENGSEQRMPVMRDETVSKIHPHKNWHQEFIKVAPKIELNKLKRMDTLRVRKIQEIMADKYTVKGVKIFDLHLLNMKK